MLGQGVGLSTDEIAAMGKPGDFEAFSATDRLVLNYAEELTRNNRVDDRLYDQLREAFSEDEIMELCGAVGLSALVNRFHATFMTMLDHTTQDKVGDLNYCPIGE